MTTWHQGQFVPVRFKLIESQLFFEWPAGAFKLYTYMRRWVWRSRKGKLGAFYAKGLLCIEGYFGQWAKAMGVSKATVSRWIEWMTGAGVVQLVRDARAAGGHQSNVYALGQVYDVIQGSDDDAIELFYADYAGQEEELPIEIELEDGTRFTPRFSESITKQPLVIVKDTQLVYFIRGANGSIKIGTTQDVVKRMARLQAGSAIKLELLAIARGGMEYEKELHERFASARVRGEWFEPTPELLEVISSHEKRGRNNEH